VSLTSPTSGATFTAPASITLTATAADSDGTIQKVDFFHGGTNLIATITAAPFTFTWTGVAQGSYTLTAVATDNLNLATTSAPVNITVDRVPALHFVHVDQLNSPRLIADATGATVWRQDNSEPFGSNPPDENPSGLGAFEFPLRFPGQYADKETGQHYNYFRDCYDPSMGRYCQSDPIGLRGGLNTYLYALADPLRNIDSDGLKTLPDKIKVPRTPQDAAEDEAKRGKGKTCAEQNKGKTHVECLLCCADPRRPLIDKMMESGTTCREHCDREHGITRAPVGPALACYAND